MSNMFTAAQAADPATPASVLAEIATQRPDLRALVAINPAAYPELLDWLRSLGDPMVLAALDRRAAGANGLASEPSTAFSEPTPVFGEMPVVKKSHRGKWIAAGVVTAVVLGSGAFAANALWFSKVGGAATPEEAAVQLVEGLFGKDVVSIYGVTSPAEFSLMKTTGEVYKKQAGDLSNESDKSGTIKAFEAYFDALDLSVDKLEVNSEVLEPGLAKVALTSGTFTVDADVDVLVDATVEWFDTLNSGFLVETFGDAVGQLPTEDEIRDGITESAADELPATFSTDDLVIDLTGQEDAFGNERSDETIDPFLMIVEEDGDWYVSPYLTALEYAAELAGIDTEPLPGESLSGVYSSPDEAAAGFVAGIQDYLATGTTAELAKALPLADRRAFTRYGTLPTDSMMGFGEFQEVLQEMDVEASYTVREKDGDIAWLTLDELTISGEEDGSPFSVTLDATCFSATSAGEEVEGCLDQIPLLGELGVDDFAMVAVQEDGAWYISGSATLADSTGLVVSNVNRLMDEGKFDDQDWLDEQLGDLTEIN